MFYVNKNWKSLGTGNLFSKILGGKIPLFSKIKLDNLATINRIVIHYCKQREVALVLDHQIEKLNSSIEKRIYGLYEIDDNEQDFIESQIQNPLAEDEEDQTIESQ
jgi:hypothetical protein